jgi:hypothetical protein
MPLLDSCAHGIARQGGSVRQPRFAVESLGPIIVEIEKREKDLKALRSRVAKNERKRLDLRLQALESSRQILAAACKSGPKMNAFFAGAETESDSKN